MGQEPLRAFKDALVAFTPQQIHRRSAAMKRTWIRRMGQYEMEARRGVKAHHTIQAPVWMMA
jgi:hypothetical protein